MANTITSNQAQITANTSNLEQFFQEVLSNSVLQNKLKAATNLESLSQLLLALGKEYGYSFSIQEVQAASAVEAAWSAVCAPCWCVFRRKP